MITDKETGWVEPTIIINGQQLTFAQAMSVRVAINSFRMFVCDPDNADNIGLKLAQGYDEQLQEVEVAMRRKN